jgi:four helix bundle protein
MSVLFTRFSGADRAVDGGMSVARRFQELDAWQLCSALSDLVFRLTETGKCRKDPEFCDQIRRAASKAPPLIAEGFLRFTPSEFVRYLRMARGELGEVQNRLLHAETLRYFPDDEIRDAKSLAGRAMAVTTALLKSKLPLLKKRRPPNQRNRART